MTGFPVDDTAVLNALFADSPQGLFVFDAERKVTRYNPAGRGVRGLPAGDVIGHVLDDFVPEFGAGQLGKLIEDARTTGGLYIVMRLSSRWGVRHSRHDKTIWSEQLLGGASPGPDPLAVLDTFDLADTAEL